MPDVLQTAMKYRKKLQDELVKLEEFLRMAEELSEGRGPEARLTLSDADASPTTSGQAAGPNRPRTSANGAAAA